MKKNEIRIEIERLQAKIKAPSELIPKLNESNDFAKPFIEISGDNIFYYVIRERNVEYERTLYRNQDEFLYRIFKDVTFEMATKYELENRDDDQDFRIILLKKQEELMSLLHADWGIRVKSENSKYLID